MNGGEDTTIGNRKAVVYPTLGGGGRIILMSMVVTSGVSIRGISEKTRNG